MRTVALLPLCCLLVACGGRPEPVADPSATQALDETATIIGFDATPLTLAPLVDNTGRALTAAQLRTVALDSVRHQSAAWRAKFFGAHWTEPMFKTVLDGDLAMTSVTGASNPNLKGFQAWLASTVAEEPSNCWADPPGTTLYAYNGLLSWTFTAYTNEIFNSAARWMAQQDPGSLERDYPGLFQETIENVVFDALAFANFANATDFNGVTVPDPWNGDKAMTPLGWNNLAGNWGAWDVGTCIMKEEANTWASGWALLEIAKGMNAANEMVVLGWLTSAQNAAIQAYLGRAYYRGAAFWNYTTPAANSSPALKLGQTNAYSTYVGTQVLDFYDNRSWTFGAYPSGNRWTDDPKTYAKFGVTLSPVDFQLNYFVGGFPTGSSLVNGIRYAYGWASAGLADNNTTGIMSLAMVYGGAMHLRVPGGAYESFSMHDYDSTGRAQTETLTLAQVGYRAMLPVNHDMADSMFVYSNYYTPRWYWEYDFEPGQGGSEYEDHAPFTIYYLAQAGAISNRAGFTTNATTAATAMGQVWQKYGIEPNKYGSCLLRSLSSGQSYDEEFVDNCTAVLSDSYNQSQAHILAGIQLWLFLANLGG